MTLPHVRSDVMELMLKRWTNTSTYLFAFTKLSVNGLRCDKEKVGVFVYSLESKGLLRQKSKTDTQLATMD